MRVSVHAAKLGCQTNCLASSGHQECHNFGFTTEMHTTFVYTSTSDGLFFVSDDDLWVRPYCSSSARICTHLDVDCQSSPLLQRDADSQTNALPAQAFVNNHLVVDIGGLQRPGAHGAIIFTAQYAAAFGMRLGEAYNLDIFHAERHTLGAHQDVSRTLSGKPDYVMPHQFPNPRPTSP